jgi:hypothetical protein
MVSPLYSGRLGLERGQLNGSLLYRSQLGLERVQLSGYCSSKTGPLG